MKWATAQLPSIYPIMIMLVGAVPAKMEPAQTGSASVRLGIILTGKPSWPLGVHLLLLFMLVSLIGMTRTDSI